MLNPQNSRASAPALISLAGAPSELNFAFEGAALFNFSEIFGRQFVSSQVIRLGQGHTAWLGSKYWWLGAPGCYRQICMNCEKCCCGTSGLVCGDLYFQSVWIYCCPNCEGSVSLANHFVVMPVAWTT